MLSNQTHWSMLLGASALVAGTCIGAAAVALPVSLVSLGLLGSCLAFVMCWALMAWTGCLTLEVNLALPDQSSYTSMALATLGVWGARVTTLIYGILLYALLAAYLAGGSDIVMTISGALTPNIHSITIAWWCLGGVMLYLGVRWIDHLNRILLGLLSVAFIVMVKLSLPSVQWVHKVSFQPVSQDLSIYLMILGAFGYQVIVPSVRVYCQSLSSVAERSIIMGSLIPLVLYSIWTLCVFGALPLTGDKSLSALQALEQPARWLPLWMSSSHPVNAWFNLSSAVEIFIFGAITTSFLGIALSAYDLVQDLSQVCFKRRLPKGCAALITLLPALCYVELWPNGFVMALKYAGLMVLLLNVILPMGMAWRIRWLRQHQLVSSTANDYQAPSGFWVMSFIGIVVSASYYLT